MPSMALGGTFLTDTPILGIPDPRHGERHILGEAGLVVGREGRWE
jgi:hypothetical protein